MKKLIIILTLFIYSFVYVLPAKAETPTPNMADQFKTQVQEYYATTEAKLKEIVELQSLVGFVGYITKISADNFTLNSHDNLLQVTTTAKTSFLKEGSAIKITSLAIDDKIIVIGLSIKDGIVQAKRVTVIKDEPVLVKTTAVVTKIVSLDTKKKTIILSLDGTDQVLTLSKKSTVKLSELQPDQTILAIVKEYNGALSISRAKVL